MADVFITEVDPESQEGVAGGAALQALVLASEPRRESFHQGDH